MIDSVEAGHARAERILDGAGSPAENAAVALNAALAARVFRGTGELADWAAAALRVLRTGEAGAKLRQFQAVRRA